MGRLFGSREEASYAYDAVFRNGKLFLTGMTLLPGSEQSLLTRMRLLSGSRKPRLTRKRSFSGTESWCLRVRGDFAERNFDALRVRDRFPGTGKQCLTRMGLLQESDFQHFPLPPRSRRDKSAFGRDLGNSVFVPSFRCRRSGRRAESMVDGKVVWRRSLSKKG